MLNLLTNPLSTVVFYFLVVFIGYSGVCDRSCRDTINVDSQFDPQSSQQQSRLLSPSCHSQSKQQTQAHTFKPTALVPTKQHTGLQH
jgi:hypothetical protein